MLFYCKQSHIAFFTLVLSLSATHCVTRAIQPSAQKSHTTGNPQPKALIFDLANVLLKTNSSSFIGTMGISTILSYSWRKKTLPWNLGPIAQQQLFTMLNRCDYTLDPEIIRARTPTGEEFPALLHGYQSGKISSADARTLIDKTMAQLRAEKFFGSETEAIFIERAAGTIFTPSTYAHGQQIIPESAALLKELAALTDEHGKKRFKIIALSNWDKESFPLFKARHEELFACFDAILISGELEIMKPNAGIFNHVLTKHGLKSTDVIFIDDQKENTQAASRMGIQSHLFTDAKSLRAYLTSLAITTPKMGRIQLAQRRQKNICAKPRTLKRHTLMNRA